MLRTHLPTPSTWSPRLPTSLRARPQHVSRDAHAARPPTFTSAQGSCGLLPRRLALPPLPARRPVRLTSRPQQQRQQQSPVAAGAAAASWGEDGAEQQQQPAAAAAEQQQQRLGFFAAAALAVRQQLSKLDGLWGKFIPMACLFFLMAFVNTISDSLKDSLVITAVGGGTHVIPYLTVYGVLPSSVLFLVLYSWGTQRFSRERLFNIILGFFVAFYAGFGLLYPSHEALHLDVLGDAMVKVVPTGLSGMVGMVRNWLFTLFYCVSELWGDVMLSLLFWGLANETTSIEDAPLLYPLFGIGANLAQTLAGRVLRILSQTAGGCKDAYTTRVQIIMALCVTLGALIMGLHAYISRAFPTNPKGSTAARIAAERAQQRQQGGGSGRAGASGSGRGTEGLAAALKGRVLGGLSALQGRRGSAGAGAGGVSFAGTGEGKNGVASLSSSNSSSISSSSGAAVVALNGAAAPAASSSNGAVPEMQQQQQQQQHHQQQGQEEEEGEEPVAPKITRRRHKKKKAAMNLGEAFDFLKRSPQIRCLAVMALAQGITCNLLDLTFKHHLHKLHSSPAAYSAFLGDTAMWTGIVTGSLMFTSPLLFERMGWKGVASATPNFMLWAGVPFFAGCVVYNLVAGNLAAAGAVTLKALVITGAVLQVVARGAKFSLFKPAEEMVYIGLDDESRTKGKAAIDVVGAQSGKSTGSMLQQALLILSGGTLGGILPVLTVMYMFMLTQWKRAVSELGDHYDPAHAHRMSMMGSMDTSSDTDGSDNEAGRAPRPAGPAAAAAAVPAAAAASSAAAAAHQPHVGGEYANGHAAAAGMQNGAASLNGAAANGAANGAAHLHANGHSVSLNGHGNGNGAAGHLEQGSDEDGGMLLPPRLPASAC